MTYPPLPQVLKCKGLRIPVLLVSAEQLRELRPGRPVVGYCYVGCKHHDRYIAILATQPPRDQWRTLLHEALHVIQYRHGKGKPRDIPHGMLDAVAVYLADVLGETGMLRGK